MKKMNKFIALITAVLMAAGALPFAAFAYETEAAVNTITTAEDESFETAVEILNEGDYAPEYSEYSDIKLFTADGTITTTAYDVEKINNDFSAETDGYMVASGEGYKLWNGIDFSSNYYVSVDFQLTANTQTMHLTNANGTDSSNIRYSGSELWSITGQNSAHQTLYASFDSAKWYKLVLEGRMKVSGAATYYSLYEYDTKDGTATKKISYQTFTLRNNWGGTSQKVNEFMLLSEGVKFDNEYAVQRWPSELVITEANSDSEVDAGGFLQFSASALIDGTASNVTQPSKITWTLSGVAEGDEELVTLDDAGKLTVNAHAKEQNITVTATASSYGNPSKDYAVKINAIDLDAEPFDSVTVSGDETIKAGTAKTYTFEASKSGVAQTGMTEDTDYVWKIMDSTGSRELGNKYISVSGGVVTVGRDVVGQTIRVRLSSKTGAIFGEKTVTITDGTSETVINFNACEDKLDGVTVVNSGSWDGTSYYVQDTKTDFLGSGTLGTSTISGPVVVSADLKLPKDAQFNLARNSGPDATLTIMNSKGKLSCYNSSFDYSIDENKWYHVDAIYTSNQPSLRIWEYADDGTKTNEAVFTSVDGLTGRKNNSGNTITGFNRPTVRNSPCIDNYRAAYPDPTTLSIANSEGTTLETAEVGAGETVNFGIAGKRDGVPINGLAMTAVNWAVYDSDNNLPISGNDIGIAAGVFTSKGLTQPQTVYVRAVSVKDNTIYASIPVTITAANQFKITNVGYDEGNENKLVRIFADKLTDYKDEVVFILTLFDGDGKLIGSYSKKANAKSMVKGANEIPIEYTLPDNFDKATGTAKIVAWTSLTTNEEPENISGSFSAVYANRVVTLSHLPVTEGKTTVAIYTGQTKDSDLSGDTSANIVYTGQFTEPQTSVTLTDNLAAGTYIIAVGGIVDGAYSVARTTFVVE